MNLVITCVSVLIAALAIGIPTLLSVRHRDIELLRRELKTRDIELAHMRGRLDQLERLIDSFANAFARKEIA